MLLVADAAWAQQSGLSFHSLERERNKFAVDTESINANSVCVSIQCICTVVVVSACAT